VVRTSLLGLTFVFFDHIQRIFAPNTALVLTTWQHDLDNVRQSHLSSLEDNLKRVYGLDMQAILVAKKAEQEREKEKEEREGEKVNF